MAGVNRTTEDSGGQAHGLRFLNDQWNDTISSGSTFMLQWNATVNPRDSELGLFQITYPEEGVVVYQLASNLTRKLLFLAQDFILLLLFISFLYLTSFFYRVRCHHPALHRDGHYWRGWSARGPQTNNRRRLYGASVMRLETTIVGRRIVCPLAE